MITRELQAFFDFARECAPVDRHGNRAAHDLKQYIHAPARVESHDCRRKISQGPGQNTHTLTLRERVIEPRQARIRMRLQSLNDAERDRDWPTFLRNQARHPDGAVDGKPAVTTNVQMNEEIARK